MGHHSCCNKQKVRRGLWSPEEDEKLIQYISTYGHGCWSSVPRLAGQFYPTTVPQNHFHEDPSANMFSYISDKDTSSVVSAVNVTPPDITWFMEFPHQHQHQQTKFAMPSEPPISSMPELCEISDSGEVPLVQPYPMVHELYDPQRSVNQIVHIGIAMGSSSMSSSSSNVVPYPGFHRATITPPVNGINRLNLWERQFWLKE
ncbi:Transcription factor MYB86 [Acorus calamus]|uniref:Transcription factor MYB86 n=1 Tax=Acorus calamus TaxID=4465 RepID=A0AAV9EFS8_ACOCL|nr:Transcription factor MYB86 [Acorus calamus]